MSNKFKSIKTIIIILVVASLVFIIVLKIDSFKLQNNIFKNSSFDNEYYPVKANPEDFGFADSKSISLNFQPKDNVVVVIDNGDYSKANDFRLNNILKTECYSTEIDNFQSICDPKIYKKLCSESSVFNSNCVHGLAVASIISSEYYFSPNQRILPINVYSFEKNQKTFVVQKKDFITSLKRIIELKKTINISVINISWNTKENFENNCDNQFPEEYKLKNDLYPNTNGVFT